MKRSPEAGLDKVLENIKSKGQDLAIFTDDIPDPDSIAAALCLQKYASEIYNLETQIYYKEKPVHPMNIQAMNNLNLDNFMTRTEDLDSNFIKNIRNCAILDIPAPSSFDLYEILEKKIRINIDHHGVPELITRKNKFIYNDSTLGSTVTFLLNMLQDKEIKFDKSDNKDKAIAIMSYFGLKIDTDNFNPDNLSDADKKAKRFIERALTIDHWNEIQEIEIYKVDKAWLNTLGQAYQKMSTTEGNLFVYSLGFLTDQGLPAYIADEVFKKRAFDSVIIYGMWAKRNEDGDYETPTILVSGRSDDSSQNLVEAFQEIFYSEENGRTIRGGGRKMFGKTVSYCGARLPVETFNLNNTILQRDGNSIREKNLSVYVVAMEALYESRIRAFFNL